MFMSIDFRLHQLRSVVPLHRSHSRDQRLLLNQLVHLPLVPWIHRDCNLFVVVVFAQIEHSLTSESLEPDVSC